MCKNRLNLKLNRQNLTILNEFALKFDVAVYINLLAVTTSVYS